jgi:hypothetical protein
MANKKFWLGLLVMVLALGMTVVGCDNGSTDDNGGNTEGTFVLTDIPATYNGKYAYFEAENSNIYIVGCQSVNVSTETITLVQISNGRASIPLWLYNESNNSVSRYSGNDTFTQNDRVGIGIFNTATLTEESEQIAGVYFPTVVFSNGGVTKSANDGYILTD